MFRNNYREPQLSCRQFHFKTATTEACTEAMPATMKYRFSTLSNLAGFAALVLLATLALNTTGLARNFSDKEIIRGFHLTVFGSEYSRFVFQSKYVHKFDGPVRFRIHNHAKRDRSQQAANFIASLNPRIRGLDAGLARNGRANFDLFIVDSEQYGETVRREIGDRRGSRIESKCLVKSTFSRSGNIRSVAVIVSDEGDALFRRCLIEEILQGLGPLNEHPSLTKSLFNDHSRHSSFTKFDRYILNMLYDRRIRNGDRPSDVQKVIEAVLADTKQRLDR